MAYPLVIKITFDPPPSTWGRRLKEVTRGAFREMAQHWHNRFLPLHFRAGNEGRYAMQARSPQYQRQKGGKPDLVFRGIMEAQMRSSCDIAAYPTRARCRMLAPAYVRINPRSGRPNLYREASRIVPEEKNELMFVAKMRTVENLKAIREKRVVTVEG